jgi:transcriptional regulator with XRE-family HTH domain
MDGKKMRTIRSSQGMTRVEFGHALGYSGDDHNIDRTVKRYEQGEKEIPPWIATVARVLDTNGMLAFMEHYSKHGADNKVDFVCQLSRYLANGSRREQIKDTVK